SRISAPSTPRAIEPGPAERIIAEAFPGRRMGTRIRVDSEGDGMHSWLTGVGPGLGIVAAKAALIYLVAVVALRCSQRRTLAQWTAIDFAAAVAVGSIIGRTSLASDQSVIVGAVALVTVLVAHRIVMWARFERFFAKLVDH